MSTWSYLLIALLLLIANGFFVAGEFALIAARRTKIEQLAAGGSARAGVALKSIKELSFMLAGAQLGITMASLGLGYVAEPAVADLIESGIANIGEVPSGVLHTISFILALVLVSFLHMVIGEMAPKNVAIAQAEKTALQIAIPFRLFANIFRPVIWFLNAISNAFLRLFGVEPKDEIHTSHTAKEIGRMVADSARGGMLKEFEHRLLSGAVGFGDRDAAAVMVPRPEMIALPVTVTPAEIEEQVVATGHSRFPIYADNIDRVLGFFHSKDLFQIPDSARGKRLPRRLIRPLLLVPESKGLHPLLFDMRRERKHVALVVDEHGGTSGIVSLEDLLEELVGDILDEHDADETDIQRLAADRFVVPGSFRIDETNERLGVSLPDGEYETIAGFLMDRLGRIPRRKDVVRYEGWNLRVREMQRRRVAQVLIEPAEAGSKSAPASPDR